MDDDGEQRLPYALWLAGNYPKALDGLCIALSFDMRVVDPAWIAKKLRELTDYSEPKGDFFARRPGGNTSVVFPSTVAYIAHLIIHRYAILGILDDGGYPVNPLGILETPQPGAAAVARGRPCPECGAAAVVRIDGCDRCTRCGMIGTCG